jgi:hypothetical protein
MKLKITPNQDMVCVRFEGCDRNFYFLPGELAPLQRFETRLIHDLARFIVAETHRLTHYYPGDGECDSPRARAEDGPFPTSSFQLFLDTNKLFALLRDLNAKGIETEVDSRRLALPDAGPRRLTVTEMVRHPNARGDIALTLKYYRDRLCADYWPRLLDTLSRFLPQAKLFGHRDEFYFDGRFPGGLGMNGGIILHGNQFSVHT